MSRILITGGAGFIGSSLVNLLMQSKNEVIVFDNLYNGSKENISNWLGNPNFKFIYSDLLLDQFILRKAIDDCDIVFHLAANPEVKVGATDTKIDYEQNVLATYNVLEAMRNSKNCKKI